MRAPAELLGELDDHLDHHRRVRRRRQGGDERLVDLEDVGRDLEQPRQRRQLDAEVVDREPETLRGHLTQEGDGAVEVAQCARLGDLHHEAVEGNFRGGEACPHAREQLPLGQLPRREVERDLELHALLIPYARLPRDLVHHPGAQWLDQSRLLGHDDELGRRHEPQLLVVPARERLDALDLTGVQIDRGLIVQEELAPVDRLAQPRDQR